MPIVIERVPDPTSPSWKSGNSGLAKSSTGQILIRSLERYLRGEISGRSVLVSGHRGAGKSTLVDLALREVATDDCRPLRVSLYGPSLFPSLRREAASDVSHEPEAPGHTRSPGPDGPAASDTQPADAQRLLMELTVALYRSLAKEVVASFERTLDTLDPATLPPRHAEIPSQLVLELDEAPGPDRLRRFWEAIRRSGPGVLFPESADPRPNQGARELVALTSAAQAFRIVAGKIDLSEESSRKAERTWSEDTETKVDWKALLGAFLALGSGLFGAAAALLVGKAAAVLFKVESLGWLGGALAAALAAVSAARTAKATSSRSVMQARSYKFIRDYKVDTLARELPNLIERVRQAGLAPVFVVDELDKVPDLARNLNGLVQELKPLVAEQTFFCFVSDRDYFEYLRVQGREAPYAPEHTYFTHRLYVSYPPKGLRDFLIRAIVVAPAPDESADTLGIERRALTYVMLFRARFQPFELSRQIQDFAAGLGERSLLGRGTIRTDAGSLYAIAYQVTVEAILRQPELESRIEQDPYFGQIAYDALYFPAEIWQRGERRFEFTSDALRVHLAARMNRGIPDFRNRRTRDPDVPAAPGDSDEAEGSHSVDRLLGIHDVNFLQARVEELLDNLALPRTLKSYLGTLGTDRDIVHLIPNDPLLVREHGKIQFSYDSFGRPYARLAQAQREKLSRMRPLLRELDRRIRSTTVEHGVELGLDSFADRYTILQQSPAWHAIAASLNAVPGLDRNPDDANKDALAIIGYGENLLERSHALALAFACAGRLVALTGADYDSCFSALSRLGKMQGHGTGDIESILTDLCQKLGARVPGQSDDPLKTLPDWLAAESDAKPDHEEMKGLRKELWWRVLSKVKSNPSSVTGLWRPRRADLMCAAARVSPVSLLQSDLADMSIAEWTTVLRLSQERRPEHDAWHVPSWMAVVASEYLGLRRAGVTIKPPPAKDKAVSADGGDEAVSRNQMIQRFASQPKGREPDHLAFVIAEPDSSAMQWHTGERVVAFVTSPDDADDTVRALGRIEVRSGSQRSKATPVVLSEVGEDRGLQAKSIRLFAGAPVLALSWPLGGAASTTSQDHVVWGASEIDELSASLAEKRPRRRPADGVPD